MSTGLVLVGLLAAVGVWDVWLATNAKKGDTISEVTTTFAHKHPMLPFALGVVIGHWLW